MHNYFFNAYRKDNGSTIGMVHIRCEEDLIFQLKPEDRNIKPAATAQNKLNECYSKVIELFVSSFEIKILKFISSSS